jgi:hypothetical protein
MAIVYPPETPANERAQYLQRPPRIVVDVADKIQTARNDLGVNEVDDETAGMSRARKVERWTGHH